MSIFKATFPEGVTNQLKARQNKIIKRDFEAIKYLNSRTAWIRMTSAVNTGAGESSDGNNTLANSNVLLGGALYNNAPRSGVGTTGAEAYSLKTSSGVTNRLGIRPMPGITGIEIKSKGGYGSLREITVNFNCWDIRQLEELELLYMRPGYTALVEWGWVPYLDNNGNLSTVVNLTNDVLTGGKTKEEIWKKIFTKASSNGNYDAIYGFIKNYSWSAREDGGYDCTTSIITMGEVLESLKINYISSQKISTPEAKGIFKVLDGTQFEKNTSISKSYSQNKLAGILNEMWAIAKEKVTANPVGAQNIKLGGYEYHFLRYDITVARTDAAATKDSFVEEDQQIYIPLKDFVHLLNSYILLSDELSGKAVVPVSVTEGAHNGGTEGNPLLCLGNRFQLSTDPTICQIKNINWQNLESLGLTEAAKGTDTETLKKLMDTMKENYLLYPLSKQLGVIGNIYVNLGYLYSLIVSDELANTDPKEKKDINLYDFLKNMLNGINSCIGNVATLDIFIDPVDSTARIIDLNYVEEQDRAKTYENAFTLEIANLRSTVRSYKLESQIFPDQTTTIAIGAQVKGGALASDNNTLLDFNKGLVDRIVPRKVEPPVAENKKEKDEEIATKLSTLKTNVDIILSYINTTDPSWYEHAGDFDVANSSKYANALKDIINFHKSFTKDDNKNKSIIPTKLSVDMDGIGGIVVGNLFKIPNDLLPKGYKGGENGIGSQIAFTVTEIGASVQNNDWVTKIGAQFIILDKPGTGATSEAWNAATSEIIKAVTTLSPEAAVEQTKIIQQKSSITDNLKDLSTPVAEAPFTVDQVIATMDRKGYRYFKDPWVLNLVGVRNKYKQQGAVVTDNFIDFMIMWYYDDKGKRIEAKAINTTTPAKSFYIGTATSDFNSIVPNQYKDTYHIGLHYTYNALTQLKSLNIVRQKATGKYDFSITKIPEPNFPGDNIHKALKTGTTPVMTTKYVKTGEVTGWSAGCQVFQKVSDFDWMMAAANQQVNKTNRKVFDYTLLKEEDISGNASSTPTPTVIPFAPKNTFPTAQVGSIGQYLKPKF